MKLAGLGPQNAALTALDWRTSRAAACHGIWGPAVSVTQSRCCAEGDSFPLCQEGQESPGAGDHAVPSLSPLPATSVQRGTLCRGSLCPRGWGFNTLSLRAPGTAATSAPSKREQRRVPAVLVLSRTSACAVSAACQGHRCAGRQCQLLCGTSGFAVGLVPYCEPLVLRSFPSVSC